MISDCELPGGVRKSDPTSLNQKEWQGVGVGGVEAVFIPNEAEIADERVSVY